MTAFASTWKLLCPIAAILLSLAVDVQSAGSALVTNFSVNGNQSSYVQVNSGMQLRIVCRVAINVTTNIHINKVDPANHTWSLSLNDELDQNLPDTTAAWSIEPTQNLPSGFQEYVLTIPNAQNGDTGNYTCYGGTGMKKVIQVDVITEAVGAFITFNGQNYTTTNNLIQVTIGQPYTVSCTVYGSNPLPTVNLTTHKGVLPTGVTTYSYAWNASYPTVTGMISRNATVTVSGWIVDNSLLGKQVTCTGGVKTPNAVSAAFVPTSNTAVPQFSCDDRVIYPKGQMDLVISCDFVAPNLTSAYVRWFSSNKNNTMSRTVETVGQRFVYPGDLRYSLLITNKTNIFYTMTVTISHAHDITDLFKVPYQFVAVNNNGQALHTVNIQDGGGPVGGAMPSTLSTVSFLLTLLIAAASAATVMM